MTEQSGENACPCGHANDGEHWKRCEAAGCLKFAGHCPEHDDDLVTPWRDLLKPWGEQLCDLAEDLEIHCQSLDDKALNALGLAANKPTETNVWWASHAVAPFILQAVRREQYRRYLDAKDGSDD